MEEYSSSTGLVLHPMELTALLKAASCAANQTPSSPTYVAYEDLTQDIVLGWVYDSLIEGEETAEEAKARIEANRSGKVQGQIDRANSTVSGIPWTTE